MNTRRIGTEYETKAEEYLDEKGLEIIERNFRTRYGEIDLIMKDKNAIVFVEVKYRSGVTAGNSLDAVNYGKRKQICRIAKQYLMVHKEYKDFFIRFDCVGIDGQRISYIRNAFDINGNII